MSVIAHQKQRHVCSPGWESRPMKRQTAAEDKAFGLGNEHLIDAGYTHYSHDLQCRVGDVWECDHCGSVWVAIPHEAMNVFSVDWRRETKRERRRRIKNGSAE
jgi:hypothetical protein